MADAGPNHFPTTAPSLLKALGAADPKERREGLNRLAVEYGPRMIALCAARFPDPGAAGDLIQDVFLTLTEHIKDEPFPYVRSDKTPFRAWLKVVVLNRLRSHFKSAYARRVKAGLGSPAAAAHLDQLAEEVAPILDDDVRLKFHAAICHVQGQVSARQAEVFRLRWTEELTPEAVAAELGISQKFVNVEYSRFLACLRVVVPELLPELAP